MISIRSPHLTGAEVSWFAPICSDDYEYLAVPENRLKSTYAHTANILLTADQYGFRNILCPSSYQVGQDTLSFVARMAPLTTKINFLAAIRCGEITNQRVMARRDACYRICTVDVSCQKPFCPQPRS